MAFEVARVHGLISSRAGDDFVPTGYGNEAAFMGAMYNTSHEWSAPGFIPKPRNAGDMPVYSSRYGNGWDVKWLPQEMSSPCSTETESDGDDEFFHTLAQQIAHSTFDEEINTTKHGGFLPISAQPETRSVLNTDYSEGRMSPPNMHNGSWSPGSLLTSSRNSSNGSSSVSSQVSSPSSAPSSGYQDAWETLYAAAGEIVRLKMNEDDVGRTYRPKTDNSALRTPSSHQNRPSGHVAGKNVPLHARRKDSNSVSNNPATQNWGTKLEVGNAMAARSQPHRAGYYHHQQPFYTDGQRDNSSYSQSGKHMDVKLMHKNRQTTPNGGSGVRVVFLGANNGRESGTGVFLPRVFDQRKSSSVRQNENNSSTAPAHGRINGFHRHSKSPRDGVWPTLQQSNNRSSGRQPMVHEPRLPSEWTY